MLVIYNPMWTCCELSYKLLTNTLFGWRGVGCKRVDTKPRNHLNTEKPEAPEDNSRYTRQINCFCFASRRVCGVWFFIATFLLPCAMYFHTHFALHSIVCLTLCLCFSLFFLFVLPLQFHFRPSLSLSGTNNMPSLSWLSDCFDCDCDYVCVYLLIALWPYACCLLLHWNEDEENEERQLKT